MEEGPGDKAAVPQTVLPRGERESMAEGRVLLD
jgi:hypothetical protein